MLERVIGACEKKMWKSSLEKVGLSTAWVFNETVAMDLKRWVKSHSKANGSRQKI